MLEIQELGASSLVMTETVSFRELLIGEPRLEGQGEYVKRDLLVGVDVEVLRCPLKKK